MSSTGRPLTVPGAAIVRAATFVLPTVSVLLATLVFLGPGALRPAMGVRVRGVPADGARAMALRVEVVKSLYEVVDVAGVQELLVEASAPGQTLRAWRGTTGPDGVAEVRLEGSAAASSGPQAAASTGPAGPAQIRGPLAVGVTALNPRPKLLAAGEIALHRAPPAFVQLGRVNGTVRGDLGLRVDVARGVLASPFPEVIRVQVSPAGLEAPLGGRAEVELSGAGIDAAPPRATTDERGVAVFRVKALAHQVELGVEAHTADKKARWEGTLPVLPGAMWLSPPVKPGAPLALLSPSPRERAYVSFWTEEGRVGGAIVPLAKDPLGFFGGEVKPPEVPGARLLFATVAGDPLELGAGTVGWPIEPAEGAVVPQPIALLLDGLPLALEREKQRAWTTRRSGLVLLGAAALAEVLLLLLQSRASQRKLEAHLVEASETMPAEDRARLLGAAREHPGLRALVAVSLVGLAFAMVAALSTFR